MSLGTIVFPVYGTLFDVHAAIARCEQVRAERGSTPVDRLEVQPDGLPRGLKELPGQLAPVSGS